MTRATRKSSPALNQGSESNRKTSSRAKIAKKSQYTYALDVMESVSKINTLLNEIAGLAKDNPLVDDKSHEHLEQLRLRMRFISAAKEQLPLLPRVAPVQWVDRDVETDPITFIQTHYKPWRGRLTIRGMAKLDPALNLAFYRYKKAGGKIPDDFVLLTKRQQMRNSIESMGEPLDDPKAIMRSAMRAYYLARRHILKAK